MDATIGGDIYQSFTGAYDALHARGLQVATLAGTFHRATDPDSEVVTIDANGVVFSQNATTGGVVNGSIKAFDSDYNVYRLDLTYSSCRAAAVVLNGRSAEGLGYFDSTKRATPPGSHRKAQGAPAATTDQIGTATNFASRARQLP